MSLSRLEKDAVQAEERRVAVLKANALAKESDQKKLGRKLMEQEQEHTRFCVKGAPQRVACRAHAAARTAEVCRHV